MSQRTEKVESLLRQLVASFILENFPQFSARVSVTGIDVSPDLRHALVWLDVFGKDKEGVLKEILFERTEMQSTVAKNTTMKFVPRLEFRLDAGGEYAAKMDRLMRGL